MAVAVPAHGGCFQGEHFNIANNLSNSDDSNYKMLCVLRTNICGPGSIDPANSQETHPVELWGLAVNIKDSYKGNITVKYNGKTDSGAVGSFKVTVPWK